MKRAETDMDSDEGGCDEETFKMRATKAETTSSICRLLKMFHRTSTIKADDPSFVEALQAVKEELGYMGAGTHVLGCILYEVLSSEMVLGDLTASYVKVVIANMFIDLPPVFRPRRLAVGLTHMLYEQRKRLFHAVCMRSNLEYIRVLASLDMWFLRFIDEKMEGKPFNALGYAVSTNNTPLVKCLLSDCYTSPDGFGTDYVDNDEYPPTHPLEHLEDIPSQHDRRAMLMLFRERKCHNRAFYFGENLESAVKDGDVAYVKFGLDGKLFDDKATLRKYLKRKTLTPEMRECISGFLNPVQ